MTKWVLVLIAIFALTASAADIAGTWKSSMETPNGTFESTYVFKVDGNKLTGTISMGQMGEAQISEGKVDGDSLSFVVVREFNGNQFKTTYKGKVAGNEMKLTMTFQMQGGEERTVELTAKKVS
jgi:hypothetical protein